tara:strand:- start:195 stop:455 length:261 start_codon:yes stop_codon:yes gene_type:complete
MIQKEIFETLNSRTTLGKFYAKYILQLKLKKYLKSKVFDYWTKELNNFLVKKKILESVLASGGFFIYKSKKKLVSINYFNIVNLFK